MKSFCMLTAFAVVLSVSGCGSDDGKDKDVLVNGFELSCTTHTLNPLTLDPGESASVVTAVLPENATLKTYEWTVAEGSGVVTVTTSGFVTAVSAGDATIKVTAKDAGGYFQTVNVHVNVIDVDYGKAVAGTYKGDIIIDDFPVMQDVELIFVRISDDKVSFSAENQLFPTEVLADKLGAPELMAFGETLPLGISADLDVKKEGDIYSLLGEGLIAFPEALAEAVGFPGLPFTVEPDNPGDKVPQIDNDGNIYLRMEIPDLGDIFFEGKEI